jgi:hypothetical protein
MTAVPPDTITAAYQPPDAPLAYPANRSTQSAGLLLIVIGGAMALFGIQAVIEGFLYDDAGGRAMGYHVIAMTFGAILIALGFLQGIVGRSIWRGRSLARIVGGVIAAIGALVGFYVLPSALTAVYRVVPGTDDVVPVPNIAAIVIASFGIAYLLVLIGLAIGARQRRRLAT